MSMKMAEAATVAICVEETNKTFAQTRAKTGEKAGASLVRNLAPKYSLAVPSRT